MTPKTPRNTRPAHAAYNGVVEGCPPLAILVCHIQAQVDLKHWKREETQSKDCD